MTTYEVVTTSIALVVIAVPAITWFVLWLIRRDRIFSNLPPGQIPADLDEAPTTYVAHGAHSWGDVAVRSTPPVGVSPGLAGVVLDGSADGRDIAAMILDLTRRGWMELRQVIGSGSAGGDWAITRVDRGLDASLDLNEVHLITNIANPGGTAWLSELCSASDNRLALVQEDLHREVVSRGWYLAPPHQTSDIPMAVLGLGGLLGLVIAVIDVSPVSIGAGAVIIACAFLTSLIVRGGTPRTALGTAMRIQILGLRRYLSEAQSYQFAYADALETFRTYLPWAVVFELENEWAEVFASLDVVAQTSELHFARDLGWFANIRDRQRPVPPTVPVGETTAPRRGAYSEEDVVATVLMTADEVAAEKLAVGARVTVAHRPTSATSEQPSGSGAPDPTSPRVPGRALSGSRPEKGLLERRTRPGPPGRVRRPRLRSTAAPVPPVSPPTAVAAPTLPSAPTPVPPVPTPASPAPHTGPAVPVVPRVRAEANASTEPGADEAAEKVPSVRQWVPKESSRPAALQTRSKPAANPVSLPGTAAPVTPVRAPAVAEAPATPPRPPTAPITPVRPTDPVLDAPAHPAPQPRTKATPVREPRSETAMLSDWMSELDRAMTGEVDEYDVEATDGGTVISGPQRFDVLLKPPVWPDVPATGDDRTRRHR